MPIPRGRLGAGGKFISTYKNPDGSDGKLLDAAAIAGTLIREAEVVGSSLVLTLQFSDDSVGEVTYNPSVAAGSGNRSYIASATYDASNGHIQLTLDTPPTDPFEIGDEISFLIPTNIDTATDNLQISVVSPSTSGNLFDTDFVEARAIDLTAGRFVDIKRVARGFVFRSPLHLEQIVPSQTARVTVTAAQLQEIDTTPVELIPAPGPGKAIVVTSVKRTFRGSDRPTRPPNLADDFQQSSLWSQALLAYATIITSEDSPYYGLDGTELVVAATGHFTGGYYAQDQSFIDIVGGISIRENLPFTLSLYLVNAVNPFTSRAQAAFAYDATDFDNIVASANDNSIEIEIEHYIRDF